VAKSELGTKRVCPDTGRKFYDLGKTPVISPYTGKVVPVAPLPQARSRPETAATTRAAAEEADAITPEVANAEFVSLEDADAEQQGKVTQKGEAPLPEEDDDDDVEVDESLDDAAFIEEEEEGDADVSDIIGETIEKEEES
jgi:uncharacterized protein (TIGR02300 family)